MSNQPLHPKDEELIRQLSADASKRHRAIPIDGHDAVLHRSNLLMVVALIGDVLARRSLGIDTAAFTRRNDRSSIDDNR